MKAMVVLALVLLPLVSRADVVIPEDEKRPPRTKPAVIKTDTTSTTSTTSTASTTTAATSTTATATTATQAPAPVEAKTVPEQRGTKFPLAAITAIGITLVVVISASRRRASKVQ